MVAKLSLPLMFLVLVLVTVNKASQLKSLERIIVMSAIISILIALLSFSPNSKHFTISGMSAAPFSAHLVVVAMLLIAQVLYEKKAYTIVILITVIFAVVAAYTRITIGGLFIGAAVMLFIGMHGIARIALPSVAVFGLAALFLLSDRFKSRMFIGSDNVSFSTIVNDPITAMAHVHGSGRFGAWEIILEKYFNPSPIIGSGAGASQHFFYNYLIDSEMGVIHSEYIRILSEVGIVGLFLFVLAIFRYIKYLIIIYHENNIIMKYPLAAIGAITSYLVFFATDNGIDYVLQLGIYVFTLIGMSIKAIEFANVEASIHTKLKSHL
jgi:O-antigen ligase